MVSELKYLYTSIVHEFILIAVLSRHKIQCMVAKVELSGLTRRALARLNSHGSILFLCRKSIMAEDASCSDILI